MPHRAPDTSAAPIAQDASTPSVPSESPSGEKAAVEHDPAFCINCGTPLHGPYCSECGQKDSSHLQPLWSLLRDVVNEVLEFDFRTWRTLRLLARPGMLSRAYLGGRRAGQIRPFRLFLVASVVMLVAFGGGRFYMQVQTNADPNVLQIEIDTDEAVHMQSRADSLYQTDGVWNQAQATFLTRLLERRDDVGSVNRFYFEWLTVPLALMVPLFALFLKATHWRRLYAEHVVVSLHLHAASFLLFAGWIGLWIAVDAVWGATPAVGAMGFLLWVAYMVASLRRIYQNQWRFTLLKAAGLFIVYVCILAGMAALYGVLSILLA